MIKVLHLFPKLNVLLMEVLDQLQPQQWDKATICKEWTVKDIAAHLLDGALRRLSAGRDDYPLKTSNINSYQDLLEHLNRLNADWVKAYGRVSPQILRKQLYTIQNELYEYMLGLDPDAAALFPVFWAGEERSSNWLEIAREYTEQWLHQQQIRQAVGAQSLLGTELYHPFLKICMQALPFHYKEIQAVSGTLVTIGIVGEAGGSWSVIRTEQGWEFSDSGRPADAQIYIDQNIAWMLFSKGMDINESAQFWQIIGDHSLGIHALNMSPFMVNKN